MFLYRMSAFTLTLLVLSGCSGSEVKSTLGINRKAPDEFRVVSRPPLSVPPEFNLRPPLDAVSAETQSSATEEARTLVLGDVHGLKPGNAPTAISPVASNNLSSAADASFLMRAGAERMDESIRQKLVGERPDQLPAEKSLLEKIRNPGSEDPLVDAARESERLKENKSAGKPVTEGETPTVKEKDTGPLGRVLGY